MSEALVDALVDELHQRRLRVWSLVITYFGDAVTPRGGVAWLGALKSLMARLRIEEGTLGAAMSRLTADGWLERWREGRYSLYRLDQRGHEVFESAARRIYGVGGEPEPEYTGSWRWLVWPDSEADRTEALKAAGCGKIGQRVFLRPETTGSEGSSLETGAVAFSGRPLDLDQWTALVHDAYGLSRVSEAYDDVSERFDPLLRALQQGPELEPVSAMAARTLLIHEFRRVVLKDPWLPSEVRPKAWAGDRARALVATLYRCLLSRSEAWLSAPERSPRPIPDPESRFYERFGGL
ncbi:MAG: PaaX family transcriptional regulator C-terminal domain-containing protein [Myxococcota bacterium]